MFPDVEVLANALDYIREQMPKSECTEKEFPCQKTIMCCVIEQV
jgi:hypothetical protein